MGETVIEPAFPMKYLRVIIDKDLLWVEHSRYTVGKISGAAHRVSWEESGERIRGLSDRSVIVG